MIRKRSVTVMNVAISACALAAATALALTSRFLFGHKYTFFTFYFLIAITISASRGYWAGILASVLSVFVIPFLFDSHFQPFAVDPMRFLTAVMVAILVSAMVATRRKAEEALRRSNEDLDIRVKERTSALEIANGELARRQEELNRAKAHLDDVLDSVAESFLALDRDWRFTYVNKRILTGLAARSEDVVGRVIWEVFPAAVKTDFYPQYHRVMKERVSLYFEVEYPESGRWFEVAAHPTKDGLSAYVGDITDRKRDEEAIGRLASIVESTSDAIIGENADGIVLTWNSAAEKIFGFSSLEAVGRPLRTLLQVDRPLESSDHFETLLSRRDGSRINVALTVSPIRNREGEVIGTSHIARDITDQLHFNARIQQVQRLESLGVLAGGIAHDFNNLLVGILGNASLALEHVPAGTREMLQDIVIAGQRAADLTSQLLAYAGKGKFYIEPVDISALVREIASLIQTSIPSSVRLHLKLRSGLPPVEADSGQLQQVVMNLVINAAEAIPEGVAGDVYIATSMVEQDRHSLADHLGAENLTSGKYIALEVRDNGCGMDEETRSRIFDPFFTTKFTGRGLGLSAVLGIVSGHKGVLNVTSEPGVGTVFRVLLPAGEGAAAGTVASSERGELVGNGNVLLVDDEEMVRKVARSALERFGYTVMEAADGRAAVDMFAEQHSRVHLIVLDLKMPNMGGEEALARLRDIRTDVPVVLSSGFSESEALRRFEGRGIAGFVQKPYTPVQLAEKVKAALAPQE